MDAIVLLRGVQTALMACAFGIGVQLPGLRSRSHLGLYNQARARVLTLLCMAVVVAVVRVGSAALVLQAFSDTALDVSLLLQTYNTQVLLGQSLCLVAAVLLLAYSHMTRMALVCLLLTMMASALSGHVVASGQSWSHIAASCIHVWLAQAWLSGVLGLLWLACQDNSEWRLALAGFSKLALPAMVMLLLTGMLLSKWTVASWAALLATNYGVLLCLKLLLITGVLFCAWQLRQGLAARQRNPSLLSIDWLRSETGLALGVLLLATWLAASVPAAHDTIDWPFGFRWAPFLAWQQDPQGTEQKLACAAALVLCAWLWFVWTRSRPRAWQWAGVSAAVMGALAVALPATSITAYPTTYMHSPVRLDAASVVAGEALYYQYCAECHGLHGQGDGPVAQLNQLRPANLTEPHVSWHSHGDMFWWLSFGKAAMPGFFQLLSEQERWHLINHLIALSFGYEARSIGHTPVAFKPWLPAMDFRFEMDKGQFMSLSEWRGLHAVHLVIINHESELQRVRALLADMKGFPAQLVIVVKPEWAKDLVKGPCEAVIVSDPHAEIAAAWSHYRRSFASPDFQNEDRWVARTEFLIDRYGFVRARWRSDESPSALPAAELKQIYESLSAEGEISSAAIHQHD